STTITNNEGVLSNVAPILDEALAHLNLKDRSAIALRYFQSKTARNVGLYLGISEPAAQKRITRALERLRGLLARRGISTPADAMELALAQSLCVAPAALASAILFRSSSIVIFAIAKETIITFTVA